MNLVKYQPIVTRNLVNKQHSVVNYSMAVSSQTTKFCKTRIEKKEKVYYCLCRNARNQSREKKRQKQEKESTGYESFSFTLKEGLISNNRGGND